MQLGEMVNISKLQLMESINERPWAISSAMFETLHETLIQCKNEMVSLATLKVSMASFGQQGSADKGYTVQDGKAVIPVMGTLNKRLSFWQMILGGQSTETIKSAMEGALNDSSVNGIVLKIDSPGGSVDGVKELADYIYNSRGKKSIVAYVDGNALSAAYWLASAADKIIAPETARAGSIGVWMAHYDASKFYEDAGVKKTYIYAGKYKVVGNEAAPLTEEDKQYLQASVDKYYSLFVNDVARNRGVSTKKVLSDMADGRIFIGTDALDAGLVDKIGTMDVAMKRADGKPSSLKVEDITTQLQEEKVMDLKQFKAEHPEIEKAVKKEAIDEFKASDEYKALESDNTSLKEKVHSLEASNKELEKKAALTDEKLAATVADREMDRVLAASGVPERLHVKVKKQMDHSKFVKADEKFEAGSKSFKEFSAAFAAEVKDWEGVTTTSTESAAGTGQEKTDVSAAATEQERLENLGREAAREATGGKIRSDRAKK